MVSKDAFNEYVNSSLDLEPIESLVSKSVRFSIWDDKFINVPINQKSNISFKPQKLEVRVDSLVNLVLMFTFNNGEDISYLQESLDLPTETLIVKVGNLSGRELRYAFVSEPTNTALFQISRDGSFFEIGAVKFQTPNT